MARASGVANNIHPLTWGGTKGKDLKSKYHNVWSSKIVCLYETFAPTLEHIYMTRVTYGRVTGLLDPAKPVDCACLLLSNEV